MLQLYNFCIFIILGLVVAFIFDLFRVLRKTFKTNNIVTYLEDILFWLITGFLIMVAVFTFNNGELRIYLFIGLLLGIIIYILLLSKIINSILLKILLPFKKIISSFLLVFKKIYDFIINKIKKCKNKSKRTIQKNNYNV